VGSGTEAFPWNLLPLILQTIILALSFGLILIGSELFTNSVEWAGERFGIAEAAVGSLLAAVGTALPETFIPAVALLFGGSEPGSHHAVGVGAIIGAPLMLSTIALFVMGTAALAYRKRRGRIVLVVSRRDARRDLFFFVPTFALFAACGLLQLGPVWRYLLAVGALGIYGAYSIVMLRLQRGTGSKMEHGLHFESILRGPALNPRGWLIGAQLVAGLIAIVAGAIEFVDNVVSFSQYAGLNPGVLSLIISPLATELPEKYNSVVWIRQRKDYLALANITGAMVFQSCIPVALGLLFTPWILTPPEQLASAIALGSAVILHFNLRDGELGTPTLVVGGVAYGVFLVGLAYMGAL